MRPAQALERTIAGRFRLGPRLRHDSLGPIFQAHDEETGTDVSLRMFPNTPQLQSSLADLKRRVTLGRNLSYPSVCGTKQLVPHETPRGSYWLLTSDPLVGTTLRERLLPRESVAQEQLLPFAVEVARGCEAAHAVGLSGLALSDETLVLTEPERKDWQVRPLLTDVVLGALPAAGRGVRSRAWLAPEQLRGEAAGVPADVFSFGVLVFRLLTGTMPLTPVAAERWARAGKHGPRLAVPSKYLPTLSDAWVRRIERCLAWAPEERFPRVGEVLADISDQPRLSLNLPAEKDAFVGRSQELRALASRFESGVRHVTLAGDAGVGKTRLATRFAWESMKLFPGGAWFCSLASAKSVDDVCCAVMNGVAGPSMLQRASDSREALTDAIAALGDCLLILDGAESAPREVGEVLTFCRKAAPDARVLVTSRERLGVAGEQVEVLSRLGVSESIALWQSRVARGRLRREHWEASSSALREALPAGGSPPLAIELHAAWAAAGTVALRVIHLRRTPDEAEHERLEQSPMLSLVEGVGGGLADAIEKARSRLHPWELAAWKQCSVFEGSWTLAAATGVLDLTRWPDAPPLFDIMQRLVEANLIWHAPTQSPANLDTEGPRFAMNATLKEFAGAELCRAGEEVAAFARHGRWFADQLGGERKLNRLRETGDLRIRRPIENDLDNLLVAIRRAVERGDPDAAGPAFEAAHVVIGERGPLSLAVSLGRSVHGVQRERDRNGRVLRLIADAEDRLGRVGDAEVTLRAALTESVNVTDGSTQEAVLGDLVRLATRRARAEEAQAYFDQIKALCDQRGRAVSALSLGVYGNLLALQGKSEEAVTILENARSQHHDAGRRRYEAVVLSDLAVAHAKTGRWEKAEQLFQTHLTVAQAMGDSRAEVNAESNLGVALQQLNRPKEQLAHAERAEVLSRSVPDIRLRGMVCNNYGNACFELGEYKRAEQYYEIALPIHRRVENVNAEADTLWNLGEVAFKARRLDDAEARCREAMDLYGKLGKDLRIGVAFRRLAEIALGRRDYEVSAQHCEESEHILRREPDPNELPQLLCVKGHVALARGEQAAAQALLKEATLLAGELLKDPNFDVTRAVNALQAAVKDAIRDTLPQPVIDRERLTYRNNPLSLTLLASPSQETGFVDPSPRDFSRILSRTDVSPVETLEEFAARLRALFLSLVGFWPEQSSHQSETLPLVDPHSAGEEASPTVTTLRQYLHGTVGMDLGSFDAKDRFARALSDVLHMTECRLKCPHCQEPSMLMAYRTKKTDGAFGFEHRHKGKHNIHSCSPLIPELELLGLFPARDGRDRLPQRPPNDG